MTTSNYETLIRRWPSLARLLDSQIVIWPIEPSGYAVKIGRALVGTYWTEEEAKAARRTAITSELLRFDARIRGETERAHAAENRRRIPMSSDDMPAEVFATLKQLWQDPRPLQLTIHPRDAWVAVAVIQYASRNPQLGATQRDAAIRVGRALQDALMVFEPKAAGYLEDGWNPEKDLPPL
jgi:hypothetical protein